MSYKFNEAEWDAFLDRLDDDSGYRLSNDRLDDFDFMLWYWMDDGTLNGKMGVYLSDDEEKLKAAGKVTWAERAFIERRILGCPYGQVGTDYATTRKALIYFLANTVPGLIRAYMSWSIRRYGVPF